MEKRIKRIDGMLLATFLTTLFYSATYPFIHKMTMMFVSNTMVAANQIINCISVIFFGMLWNKKSEKLFKNYAVFCCIETVLTVLLTIWVTATHNIVAYYFADNFIFALVTRNICCGGVKLRAIRYNTESERERFDNNNNSASAAATIIGSLLAMVLNLDFSRMLWLATLGNTIDNVFYIRIFINTKKGRQHES